MTDSAEPSSDIPEDSLLIDEEPPAVPTLQEADLGLELPEDPDAAKQVLLGEIAATRAAAGEYLDAMQRLAAEFDNFRKRVDRDRAELVDMATSRLITDMLPTLDNFDAALAYDPQTPAEEKILDGMKSTRTQLLDLLSGSGLEPVATDGAAFDPAVHEAVSGPSGDGSGDLVIAHELRRGYVLNGRLIRAALVTVEHASPAGGSEDTDA